MSEISRERRAELRLSVERMPPNSVVSNICFVDELRTLLDYADERDEAVALLREARDQLEVLRQFHDGEGWWSHGEQAHCCSDPTVECPINMGEWISDTDREGFRRIDALLRRVGGSDE